MGSPEGRPPTATSEWQVLRSSDAAGEAAATGDCSG